MNLDDTIVAVSTPPGRGGIGVVRLAGVQAKAIAETMLRRARELEAGRAVLCDLVDPSAVDQFTNRRSGASISGRIDEVVVTYFAKPHSYTTDDIVEISAHGSPIVLRHIVDLSLAQGARLAEPDGST
jgi:tRNA modification GTPase